MKIISRVFWLCLVGLGLNFVTLTPAQAGQALNILLVGDDFTNGSGLTEEKEKLATQLFKKLKSPNLAIKELSPNSATTGTVISSMDRIVRDRPDMVILAVGSNDALKGTEPDVTYSNLDTIVRELLRNNIYVVVVSAQAPPTVSQDFAMLFNGIFPRLAAQHRVFMVDGVYQSFMGDRDLTQFDLIHPNKFGVSNMTKILSHAITPILPKLRRARRCSIQPDLPMCTGY